MIPTSIVQNLKQLSYALEPQTEIKLSGTNFSLFISGDVNVSTLIKLSKKIRGFYRKNK